MRVVLKHLTTGLYRAPVGRHRGWTTDLQHACLFHSVDQGMAHLKPNDRPKVRPLYLYLHEEPLEIATEEDAAHPAG